MARNNGNIYLPMRAVIEDIEVMTSHVRLFTVNTPRQIVYKPGQFFMVSVDGFGEVPISVASTAREPLMFCIRRVGHVTEAIHALSAGDTVGLRGPYGNGFQLEISTGRDVVIVTGGIGIVPLRPLIKDMVEVRKDYGRLFLLYGSKKPKDMLFKKDISEWEHAGVKVIHTVDCAEEGWKGCVGLVTSQIDSVDADFKSAVAYVCGPPLMMDSCLPALSVKGIPGDRIIVTLEAHMKCGVGKCGHCYMGPRYICTDGPVFSMGDLSRLELKDGY